MIVKVVLMLLSIMIKAKPKQAISLFQKQLWSLQDNFEEKGRL